MMRVDEIHRGDFRIDDSWNMTHFFVVLDCDSNSKKDKQLVASSDL